MDWNQLTESVIDPTLRAISMYSPSASLLLLGTGELESEYVFVHQKDGPALSFWGIEPRTNIDTKRYLDRWDKKSLKERVLAASFYDAYPSEEALLHNMRWAITVARLKYWPDEEPLPKVDDAIGLAKYYKRIYNTEGGKTTIDKAIKVFTKVVSWSKGQS